MKKQLTIIFFVLLFFVCFIPSVMAAGTSRAGLTVAAVQYEIVFDNYTSTEAFWSDIDRILEEIDAAGTPDLIVFPEYTGVFYTLIPYTGYLSKGADLETVLWRIAGATGTADVPAALFYREKALADEYIREWGRRAAEYETHIIAGSLFYSDYAEGELRNRALVLGPAGELLYYQDKVFLTDFETDLCRLSPGRFEDARGFEIAGQRIYLTICRDTFLKEWEQFYSDSALLWIDIKANGVVYDEEQIETFSRALPARLPRVPVDYGLTLCLTGNYLDLLWEGESSLLEGGEGALVLETSKTVDREEILYFSLPANQ